MPRLIRETRIMPEWMDSNDLGPVEKISDTHVRRPGWHLSGIIKHCLMVKSKFTPSQIEEEFMPMHVVIGMAWEDRAVRFWPGLQWQPGERTLDEISGNCDGINHIINPETGQEIKIIEEFKATWKSRWNYGNHGDKAPGGSGIVEQALWMWQLAGYCKLYKAEYARLHIFWVNGDYRPPSPDYRTYLLHFPKKEVNQFWDNVVLGNRDDAPKEGQAKEAKEEKAKA